MRNCNFHLLFKEVLPASSRFLLTVKKLWLPPNAPASTLSDYYFCQAIITFIRCAHKCNFIFLVSAEKWLSDVQASVVFRCLVSVEKMSMLLGEWGSNDFFGCFLSCRDCPPICRGAQQIIFAWAKNAPPTKLPDGEVNMLLFPVCSTQPKPT